MWKRRPVGDTNKELQSTGSKARQRRITWIRFAATGDPASYVWRALFAGNPGDEDETERSLFGASPGSGVGRQGRGKSNRVTYYVTAVKMIVIYSVFYSTCLEEHFRAAPAPLPPCGITTSVNDNSAQESVQVKDEILLSGQIS